MSPSLPPSPSPIYKDEAEYVLDMTKTMATSDEQKMIIEYYDSKFTRILPIQINYSIMSGQDNFEFWYNVYYFQPCLVCCP